MVLVDWANHSRTCPQQTLDDLLTPPRHETLLVKQLTSIGTSSGVSSRVGLKDVYIITTGVCRSLRPSEGAGGGVQAARCARGSETLSSVYRRTVNMKCSHVLGASANPSGCNRVDKHLGIIRAPTWVESARRSVVLYIDKYIRVVSIVS